MLGQICSIFLVLGMCPEFAMNTTTRIIATNIAAILVNVARLLVFIADIRLSTSRIYLSSISLRALRSFSLTKKADSLSLSLRLSV